MSNPRHGLRNRVWVINLVFDLALIVLLVLDIFAR